MYYKLVVGGSEYETPFNTYAELFEFARGYAREHPGVRLQYWECSSKDHRILHKYELSLPSLS